MDIDYEAGEIPVETLGDRMDRALKFAKVGVAEMAEHLGVSRNSVGRYLSDRTPPSRSTLRVWALRCGVPLSWLITGERPPGTVDTGPYAQLQACEEARGDRPRFQRAS